MRSYISALLKYLSSFQIVQSIFKGKGIILMLHRIAPFENKLSPNENMKVTPDFLEQFIIQSLESGYIFISLDELHDGLIHNNLPEYFICITIDDGYKDNLTFGYPIFERHNIPFCIYICTSFPESSHNMWWFALEDYLLAHQNITFNNKQYDISTLEAKEEVFLCMRNHIITQTYDYQKSTECMEKLNIIYNPHDYNKLALNWDDILWLDRVAGGGQNKLCTIGAHTHSHPIFNRISQKQVIDDITYSQNLFLKKLGHTPLHFAYPFGGRTEVHSSYFHLIKDLGFISATTTRHGCIYPAHSQYLHALPRVFFKQNFMLQSAFKIRRNYIVSD